MDAPGSGSVSRPEADAHQEVHCLGIRAAALAAGSSAPALWRLRSGRLRVPGCRYAERSGQGSSASGGPGAGRASCSGELGARSDTRAAAGAMHAVWWRRQAGRVRQGDGTALECLELRRAQSCGGCRSR